MRPPWGAATRETVERGGHIQLASKQAEEVMMVGALAPRLLPSVSVITTQASCVAARRRRVLKV